VSAIVQIECFKGYHHISNGCYGDDRLQAYIDRYEDDYLCMLLGSELMALLISDLTDGVPTNAEYLEWFNPFCQDITNCCNEESFRSRGLKDMLTGFIYYHYVHSSQMRQTQTGTTIQNSNNSDKVGMINNERDAEARYNEAIDTYNAISARLGNCNSLQYKLLDIL